MFEEYKAFKEKVGVDDVAAYLGYKLDRKAGIGNMSSIICGMVGAIR